jgi:hypothetical protein
MLRKQIVRTMRKAKRTEQLSTAVKLGYKRIPRTGMVTHFGQWVRHGRIVMMSEDCEDWIVDHHCGGCLVSLYTLQLRELTELITQYNREVQPC